MWHGAFRLSNLFYGLSPVSCCQEMHSQLFKDYWVAKKLPQSASSTLVNCLCSYFSVNMTTFLWILQPHFTRARSTLAQTYFPRFNDEIFISYTTLCRTLDYLTVTWSCSLSGRHLLNSWKLYIYIFIYIKKSLSYPSNI